MKRRVLVLALVGSLFLPLTSEASGIPVVDILAWIQRALAYIEQLRQVENEIKQLQAEYKQLESFAEGGAWTDLFPLVSDLRDLYNRWETGENVGYLLADAEEMFRETFPGYALEPELDDTVGFELRVDRAQETLALITASLNMLARDNDDSVNTLRAIQNASASADGLLEEMEVSNMFQSHQAGELQKSNQALMLGANASLVAAAFAIQETANATAARRHWLSTGPDRRPGEDNSEGFTGVPSSLAPLNLF